MTYQVLARKWRPQTFDDLAGQDHITSTLTNAISNQRVGHAYIFVGTRGIGKTTSARIFAKALNCENPRADLNPCGKCTNCVEITQGSSIDVIEIDGASNNSVDDIRQIREGAQYTPARCPYKIFIIDEVHMLSNAAWNALLKTLEEPPPHIKFLFATTEVHRVLPTILSRCQRLELKPIPRNVIAGRLKHICETENVAIEDAAINAISRTANGGMRDGLSILDQMISFCSGNEIISEQDVIDVFGMSSSNELKLIASAILQNQAPALIEAIDTLAKAARNMEQLYSELFQLFRDVMILLESPQQARSILDLEEVEIQQLHELAQLANNKLLQKLLNGFLDYDGKIRHTLNKRTYLEVTLLRIMKDAHSLRVEDLLKHIQTLRKQGNLQDLEGELPPLNITQKKNESLEARSLRQATNAEALSIVKKPIIDTKVEAEVDTVNDTQNIGDSSASDTQNDYYEEDIAEETTQTAEATKTEETISAIVEDKESPEEALQTEIEEVTAAAEASEPVDNFQASPSTDQAPVEQERHSNSIALEQMLAVPTSKNEDTLTKAETIFLEKEDTELSKILLQPEPEDERNIETGVETKPDPEDSKSQAEPVVETETLPEQANEQANEQATPDLANTNEDSRSEETITQETKEETVTPEDEELERHIFDDKEIELYLQPDYTDRPYAKGLVTDSNTSDILGLGLERFRLVELSAPNDKKNLTIAKNSLNMRLEQIHAHLPEVKKVSQAPVEEEAKTTRPLVEVKELPPPPAWLELLDGLKAENHAILEQCTAVYEGGERFVIQGSNESIDQIKEKKGFSEFIETKLAGFSGESRLKVFLISNSPKTAETKKESAYSNPTVERYQEFFEASIISVKDSK